MIYVLFNTREDAEFARNIDNQELGYPNSSGTDNAWQWIETQGYFLVITDGLPAGCLDGYERLTNADLLERGVTPP